MTVAHFRGGACTLRRSEGDVFYRNSENYSSKRVIGVNPLPREDSVGELGKNLTPSKLQRCRDFDEFLKAVEKEPSNVSSFMILENSLIRHFWAK
jgi:hypothetical protein